MDQEPSCGSAATVAVFSTLITVLVLEAILYIVWKIYWRGKSGQHLVLVTDTEKGDLFAYDNPGFKEGPSLMPPVEKETKGIQQSLKWPQWASIGLIPNSNKVKAMDDTFTTQPVLTVVPLRSHDFTGLGFNICGNMRDGIFVKDVLHRGPASESGRIMPGDRIESLKISLRHMVFEDALTILSYASPYEVELAVESRTGSRVSTLMRHPPPPHKICHPFYKSHSISDLQQIEKSNSRRSGDLQTSMMSDMSGDVCKPATLEKKPKVEAERIQNSKNTLIESVQKTENCFHTIDLDEPDRKESNSPSNVKAMLVKGIQNLKDKLHNTLHQDEERTSSGSPSSTLDKRKIEKRDEGFTSVELSVPDEVTKAGVSARSKRKSTIEYTDFISDCDETEKKGKRKAPMPPQVNGDEEHMEEGKSETAEVENEFVGKSGTIELDSSHVTVHQADNEGRKASSLGDLSRYENDNVTVLERAVSLDLADGGSTGKKRKAPLPPQDSSLAPYKEARLDSTLKKSDVWGTLADVLQTSDSETDLGISGCSTPERIEIQPSSTPFKFSESIKDDSTPQIKKFPNLEALSNNIHVNSWDLSAPIEDLSTSYVLAMNGNSTSGEDTPPQLPTSPVPPLEPYITEIQVVTEEKNMLSLQNDLIDTEQTFHKTTGERLSYDSSDNVLTLNNDSYENSLELNNDSSESRQTSKNEPPESRLSMKDETIDTRLTIKSNSSEERITCKSEAPDNRLKFKNDFENHNFQNDSPGNRSNYENERPVLTQTFKSEPDLAKFSIVEIETDERPSNRSPPRSKTPQPQKSNITTTSIKTGTSRIPVRAGQRSPGGRKHSPEQRRLTNRNGHHSP